MNLPALYEQTIKAVPAAAVPRLKRTSLSWWLASGDDSDIPDAWAEYLILAHWQGMLVALVESSNAEVQFEFDPARQRIDYFGRDDKALRFQCPTYLENLAAAVVKACR